MSVGPSEKDGVIKISPAARVEYATKKALSAFFENPLFYILYSSLAMLLIGLFLGMHFAWEFYVIVGILAIREGAIAYFPPKEIIVNIEAPAVNKFEIIKNSIEKK